jgi:hypothetical protein
MIFNVQIALKIQQKALAAGAWPRTPLGELTTFPRLIILGFCALDPAGGANGPPQDPLAGRRVPIFLCPLKW